VKFAKDNVLQIQLNSQSSLDIIRVPEKQRYLVAIAEHGVVQRRTLVPVSYDDARKIAYFFSGVAPPENELPNAKPPEAEPE
jgi:hypothetical protein